MRGATEVPRDDAMGRRATSGKERAMTLVHRAAAGVHPSRVLRLTQIRLERIQKQFTAEIHRV
jgi:hypothetical protein